MRSARGGLKAGFEFTLPRAERTAHPNEPGVRETTAARFAPSRSWGRTDALPAPQKKCAPACDIRHGNL